MSNKVGAGLTTDFAEIGPNRFQFRGQVPVDLHMTPHLFQGQRSRRVLSDLKLISEIPTLVGTVHGMPDLCREKDDGLGVPCGVTFTTRDGDGLVVPAGNPDTGCGYRLLVARGTGANSKDDVDVRAVLSAIESLPQRWNDFHRDFDLDRIMTEGAPYIVSQGVGNREELSRIESGGVVPGADPGALPQDLWELASEELGLHGHNGHFIELMRVERPLDGEALHGYNLHAGDLLLVLHTGSEVMGLNVFLRYFRRMMEAIAELPNAAEDPLILRGLFGVPYDTDLGHEYLGAALSLMNYAFARRQLIGHLVTGALNETLGLHADANGFQLLSDLSHVAVEWEPFGSGRRLRHRRGMQRLLRGDNPASPGAYPTMGVPAVVCGEVGIPSFLVAPGEAAQETDFLLNHGMGVNHLPRKLTAEERECLTFPMGVICNQMDKVLRYHNPHRARLAVQNIHDAITSLAAVGVIRPITRLQPIVTFRGASKRRHQDLNLDVY